MMKLRYFGFTFFILGIFGVTIANAQEWRKIRPLSTTCNDLKSILNIHACKFPVTVFKDDSYWIHINFTDSGKESSLKKISCIPIPQKTVVSVSIRLIKGIYLRDLETNFANYSGLVVPDLPESLRLVNTKRGIDITLHNSSKESSKSIVDSFNSKSNGRRLFTDVLDELSVEDILIKPTAEQSKRYCLR